MSSPGTVLFRAPQASRGAMARLVRPAALAACLAAFALPTLSTLVRTSWATEQGAHGPLVAGIGLWLLYRALPQALERAARPPDSRVAAAFALILPAYLVTRIGGIIELEGYLMYAGLLAVLYALIGGRAMRLLWFPLLFLALAFPPPDTLVALVTQPLKLAVSHGAVGLLGLAGYPIGGEGVHIYIGTYELLVAEACSGLNSLISLTALAMLYVYLRHRAGPAGVLLFAALSVPVAVLANLVRVLVLVLLTYHAGEAVGQGFLHLFAGLTTFVAALIALIALDAALRPLLQQAAGR